ncbi:hypothetical protein D9O40_07335 [Clostridium autoethanogenum]|uniref:Ethanolamine utilization protein n=1 Tax=Clostridium autoethanogenum TaxID=84023 RepID=A0A3M0SW79_9CLOT|nr:hypothetical protein [Clostridium autoethanogenum]RMD02092.1 hypothetical protein D9O40_07335 [Clostridium autoethanogenum]
MDINAIVDMVTREIMKRLKDENGYPQKSLKRILVLDKSSDESFKIIEQKLNFLGYEIDYMKDKKDTLTYEKIIITSLSNKEIVNMAMGLESGIKEQTVLEALLLGKKVFLLDDGIAYRKYAATSNKALYKLYEEYEKKLCEYGVRIVDRENFVNEFSEPKQNNRDEENIKNSAIDHKNEGLEKKNKNILEFTGKKLITESEIRKACEKGYIEISVPKKAIITSLAVDYIKINGLKVNRIG